MLLISHRGNIDKIIVEKENTVEYIDEAIEAGYDVEIDIWFDNGFYLGHDKPEYLINPKWLYDRSKKIWVHTKNFPALRRLIDSDLRVFFHEKEKHTIINKCDVVWSHDINEADEKSIIPLLSIQSLTDFVPKKVYGICSDFIGKINV